MLKIHPIVLATALIFAGSPLLPPFFPASHAFELPDLGEVSRATLSESNEDRIGREIMRQMRDSPHYLNDPVITDYLNNLGLRLAAASPAPGRQFEFFAVQDSSINAFAMPGGFIGVHTGLISAARNESELAGVLAHEIAHVTQSHIARIVDTQKNAGLASLAAIAIAIMAARSNPEATQAAIVTAQAMNIQNQLNFTREHEREADRIGLQTLAAAHFSPLGMGSFFERLQMQSRLYENNAPAYLRTHPLTHERIADIQNRLDAIPYRQFEDSIEFSLVRARVQAAEGEARDALRTFEARVREQPGVAAWYGLALAHARMGQFDLAEQALTHAQAQAQRLTAPARLTTPYSADAPLLDLTRAELLMARGQAEQAAKVTAVALVKNGAYRPLAYQHIKALQAANQAEEALKFINERQRIWTADGTLFALKAQAHQALGHKAESFLAQAEAYALADRIGAAIEQLQLAQRQGKTDFFTLSIIDARLRELRARQTRETSRQ
jgi:predicted Zn-dependent protease